MDEVDAVPNPRRRRPKDSFQNELQSRLHQRKHMGLATDITDSDEDELGPMGDYQSNRLARPGSAKRRPDHSPDLGQGLGTTTMRSRDLTQLLGNRGHYDDDDDEEVMAATLGRASPGLGLLSSSRTTPSPKDSKFLRKKENPQEQTGKLGSIFGKKTPTKETSPQASLSKEDIIFGRKTPTLDGKKSPYDGSKRLPGVDGSGSKQWQPPNYRSVSPSSSVEHSRGSRGATPVDSALDPISETPREKMTPRMQRGHKNDGSPKQLSFNERPTPQARGKVGERKTPPLIDPRRKSPLSQTETESTLKRSSPTLDPRRKSPLSQNDTESSLKRSTPTLDLFGRSRTTAAQEVDRYLESDKDKDKKRFDGRRTPENRQTYGRSQSPESRYGPKSRDKTPERSSGGKFIRDGKKTPTSSGRKSPLDKKREEEKKPPLEKGASLLDFLMDDNSAAGKPKPQERGKKARGQENDEVDDIFGTSKKPALKSQSREGRKSPGINGRKTPEQNRKSPVSFAQQEDMFKTIPKQQRAEDTSSLCEEIPPDPNRKIARENAEKSKSQTTERAKADNDIDSVFAAQTMKYIEPAKKIRPVTANAKVQHRPKPRYGTLPGQKTGTLQDRQFNSTGDIRDAIYEEWYRERLKSAKQKKRQEERNALAEEDKKKKEQEEKRLEAEASYRAWMKNKKEYLMTEQEKKEEEEKKKRQKEEEEKKEKEIESKKSFESWKKKKDSLIKRELRKKDEEKKDAEEEKKRLEYEKRKDKETAYRGWVKRKEAEHHKKVMEKKRSVKTETELKEDEKEELRRKEQEALDRYYEWMEEKEKQAKLEKKRARQRHMMGSDEFKPAWSPASRTVPFGR